MLTKLIFKNEIKVLIFSCLLLALFFVMKHISYLGKQELVSIARYKIDLNTSAVDELGLLPGIGEVRASRIQQFRQDQSAIQCFEDLEKVPGIGPKIRQEIQESPHVVNPSGKSGLD